MQAEEAHGLSVESADVLQSAGEWQKRLDHPFFHTGHLLCGLMQVQSKAAVFLRQSSEVTMNKVAEEVFACFAAKIIDQTQATRQVSEAVDEARTLADDKVEPEHILLVLLQSEGSVAYQVLSNLLGAKLTRVCTSARDLLASQEPVQV